MRKFIILPAIAASALALSACSTNYAGEGALVGAAGRAAVGAAAGAVAGTLIKKDGRCYERDRYGYEYEVRC